MPFSVASFDKSMSSTPRTPIAVQTCASVTLCFAKNASIAVRLGHERLLVPTDARRALSYTSFHSARGMPAVIRVPQRDAARRVRGCTRSCRRRTGARSSS
jgi:hypothetical protein